MEPSMLIGGGLAVLVFGFLAFQDRLVSMLMGRRERSYEELIEKP